jgi:hydroxyethylthiazole kinase-like uncharacterized protein yjeF
MLYTIEEVRRIEQAALAELPVGELMQRAGKEAAELAWRLLPRHDEGTRVLVLAGPGNNGGDALELAIILANRQIQVSVLQIAGREDTPEEFRLARKRAISTTIQWEDALAIHNTIKSLSAQHWDLVVDGLFGIGLRQILDGNHYQLAELVNAMSCPVLALDVPSGLNADTGCVQGGEKGIAIRATDTITFLGNKPGLYTFQGRDHAGRIHHTRLGLDDRYFPPSRCWLNNPACFPACLTKRVHDSHKGSYGRVAILGGDEGMTGAPILAARAALYAGTGRVHAVYLKSHPEYDPAQPELMFCAAHRFDFSSLTTVAGPGLGTSIIAHHFVEHLLELRQPVVLDADALNLIAASDALKSLVEFGSSGTIITPHPLEAARLLGQSVETIQADRIRSASRLAQSLNVTVVLKGSGTIIADAGGRVAVNPTGGPALASAGTGDVLAGICGAFLAQGISSWESALAGVWLHGKAADELAGQGIGPTGLTAGELIPMVRQIRNRLVAEQP